MGGYKCGTCGKEHEELPRVFATRAPEYWYEVPEKDRDRRTFLSPDQCIVDDAHFFVRGVIEIPVLLEKEPFTWGVWCSLSKASFCRMEDLWTTTGREKEPPCFGWLSTRIPAYPDTVNLKTHVHTREVGTSPRIEVEPTDHPLAMDQRNGISAKRMHEIVEECLRGQ